MSLGGIKFAGYDPTTKRIFLTKDGVVVTTDAYFYILLEVFGKEEYGVLRSLVDRPFVVYDLGINRGYASLWFANHPQCRKVYGFELLEAPYQWALKNFVLNSRLAAKIEAFCVGLSGANTTTELFFEEGPDGVTTVMPEFYAGYLSEKRKTKRLMGTVPLRQASEIFAGLPPCTTGECRVLKIDVEGAEYDIVADLGRAGMLDFDIILAETHLGVDKFLALTPNYTVVDVAWHSKMLVNVALVRKQ
jgi:FkbM family methyltransferase